jgi:putative ABC transport system substrate-binding protein
MKPLLCLLAAAFSLASCSTKKSDVPKVAFVDAFQDNTIALAKQGFFDALSKNGFDEKKGSLTVIYRNAQGDIPTLTQITQYMIAQQPDLIATCPTLSTITAIQNTKSIPVFMMVSGTPALMKLNDANGKEPANLFGTGETLGYIDTSFGLIRQIIPRKGKPLRVGMVFNQSEPQSAEAVEAIKKLAVRDSLELVALPVNASADVQLVTRSLLAQNIDVFFANPDNTVFAAFESIVKGCDEAGIPIITSEAGLVARGALAAFGADIYQWGYQAGTAAAAYLQNRQAAPARWEVVRERKKVFNPAQAKKFNITLPADFKALP